MVYSSATPQSATIAQVTFSEPDSFGAVSTAEHRQIPVFTPRGISYRPCQGDNLLLVHADGTDVCAGVLASTDSLEEGELRLVSAGGACIHLTQDGKILLNGITITPSGEVLLPSHKGES